jgi:hypothetical protein
MSSKLGGRSICYTLFIIILADGWVRRSLRSHLTQGGSCPQVMAGSGARAHRTAQLSLGADLLAKARTSLRGGVYAPTAQHPLGKRLNFRIGQRENDNQFLNVFSCTYF